MPEPATSQQSSSSAEIDELRAEVARLRALLVEKDIEMGKVRGRLQQLEDRTTRILGAAAWLRRFGPPFARFRAKLRGRP